MRSTTLCFPVHGSPIQRILLGMKKTGFGFGKYNGFGGKIEEDETVIQAAIRELKEECGIEALPEELELVGLLDFIFPASPELDHDVYIYLVKSWKGQSYETNEMKPQWFQPHDIPYEHMWSDDIFWLPKVLDGDKIKGKVIFTDDNEGVRDVEIHSDPSLNF